jgi:hypothetical protein
MNPTRKPSARRVRATTGRKDLLARRASRVSSGRRLFVLAAALVLAAGCQAGRFELVEDGPAAFHSNRIPVEDDRCGTCIADDPPAAAISRDVVWPATRPGQGEREEDVIASFKPLADDAGSRRAETAVANEARRAARDASQAVAGDESNRPAEPLTDGESPSPLAKELSELMERERRRAILERARAASAQARLAAPEPSSSRSPATRVETPQGPVTPDSQINDLFAAIDRGPDAPTTQPAQAARPVSSRTATTVAAPATPKAQSLAPARAPAPPPEISGREEIDVPDWSQRETR